MGLRVLASSMEDQDGTLASVAQCIEQLRQHSSSLQDKEISLKHLLNLIETRESAPSAVGSHSQAVPILVSLLRLGSLAVKIQAASVLASLCKDDELRVKVLLGGCIPPLLGLLKSSISEGQIAAAKAIFAVSQDGVRDHVGSKIFSTEGVVVALWEQLEGGVTAGNVVDSLLTGALRNLSSNTEGLWSPTIEAGGVDILVKLLKTGQPGTQGNVCFLLSSVITKDPSVCPRILELKGTKQLLKLLGSGNEDSVRAESANALRSLSSQSKDARRDIVNSNGIPILINSTIAPSKEFMQGEYAQALQENSMCALANISGGLSNVISSLGQSLESCTSPPQIADTLGALASALMIYDEHAESIRPSDPLIVEQTLVSQFKPKVPFLVQERTIEALATLYGNSVLSEKLPNSDAKVLLVGLITMAGPEIQEELVKSLLELSKNRGSLWQGRDLVQLLISLLGSSEQQQECAASLLCLLSKENNESKWAITAAGGIPPLVQILETGSSKAKEDSATILGNLCSHSEDIRACVESANAVPALLWLLKNGTQNGKRIAAETLNYVIPKSDTGTMSQLTVLLTSDLPESKVHVLDALKNLLAASPLKDILKTGSASNDAIETIIGILGSAQEETKAKSASVLAGLFDIRKDLRETSIAIKALLSVMELLQMDSELIPVESFCCVAAILLSIQQNPDISVVARDLLGPLVRHGNSSILVVAEQATRALANLLLDVEISSEVSPEDIVFPITKVLCEGTLDGRTHAAAAISRLLLYRSTDSELADCINRAGTVAALISLLESTNVESAARSEALDALVFFTRLNTNDRPAWQVSTELPHAIVPIASCITNGTTPNLQDKSIEFLSRLCLYQSHAIGNVISNSLECIALIVRRINSSTSTDVKIGGITLLLCAAEVDHKRFVEAVNESSLCVYLIQSLIGGISSERSSVDKKTNMGTGIGEFKTKAGIIFGDSLSILLLSILACHDHNCKATIAESGGVQIITEKLSQRDAKVAINSWVFSLLLAIMFQDRDVIRVNTLTGCIPELANLLKSEVSVNKYFAAQALVSLVCNGSRGTLLSIANSGAVNGLISLLGFADADMHDLLELSKEFALVPYPEQLALERLFRVDHIRVGATSRKAIPVLVDLLKPIPNRPGAPYLALKLLTQLAINSIPNKTAMVESGALEALTKYLSLGPQDATEEATTELLRILFESEDIRKHDSTVSAANQLVAVLRLGGRGSRYSASKALESLFSSDHIRNTEVSRQAIQPLVEIVNAGLEREQSAAINALGRLYCEIPSRSLSVTDSEVNAVDVLCRILSSNCSMELKGEAAELCCGLFRNTRIRSTIAATRCVVPLLSLLLPELNPSQHSVVRALNKLLDDEKLAELIASQDAVISLVALLSDRDYIFHEAVSRALVKLGKDRPACKRQMVKAGVVKKILDILHEAPDFLCAEFSELLRILTNNSDIAEGSDAAKLVGPLFLLLRRPEFGLEGQASALRVLINILEHPHCRADYSPTSHDCVEPLIPLLDSRAPRVQQLAAELLSHLLSEEHLQHDIVMQQVVGPLIHVLGSGIQILQHRSIKALVSISSIWPNEIAKENGVSELSRAIFQDDPPLPHTLWESAASVLCGILQFSSENNLEVPVAVLVRLLRSGKEATVTCAVNALLVLESDDTSTAEAMAESGAIEALLALLGSHQCEETGARLLEVLLNNVQIRETRSAKSAILPLSQYLLDPQTQVQQAKFFATLALGDLFQSEGLARTTDAVSACRALVNVLEDQPTNEMKVVAICALQNLVMHSRANKRAVAEAGGIQVILDLISTSDLDISIQAAMFIQLLFSNNTIQEYASVETVRVITAAIEKDLWTTGSVNEEYLKSLNTLLGNFPRLRASEPATLIIPHLVSSLKNGSESTQEAALDALTLFRQAWSVCPAEVSIPQSVSASEAIPLLQYLNQHGPSRFKEKVEHLLQCLPGTLTVTVKHGINLKQSVGNPSVYCKLSLGNAPPKKTKIVSTGPNPEFEESFTWSFDGPPRGQKLQISCKNKSKFGKNSFGKVTLLLEEAVLIGAVAAEYPLYPQSKSGPSRKLVIEFLWSNTINIPQ